MRLYGSKYLRNATDKRLAERQELRDAVVWDINEPGRYARVKVQGSDKLITAHYPLQANAKPVSLKVGNAVRIASPGGNKGRIEIIGHGLLRPTVMGTATPTLADLGDGVLSGFSITPDLTTTRGVIVSAGTFRVAGTTYSAANTAHLLGDGSMPLLGGTPAPVLGGSSTVLTFAATTSGRYRYDLIVVDATGIPHIEPGAQFYANAPLALHDVSADHVRVGWVLIHPNQTVLTASSINRVFSAPDVQYMTSSIADRDLTWGQSSTTITVSFYDQYDNTLTPTGIAALTVAIQGTGTGIISQGTNSSHASLALTPAATNTITYVRYAGTFTDPELESSPMFAINAGHFSAMDIINLYDAGGLLLYV